MALAPGRARTARATSCSRRSDSPEFASPAPAVHRRAPLRHRHPRGDRALPRAPAVHRRAPLRPHQSPIEVGATGCSRRSPAGSIAAEQSGRDYVTGPACSRRSPAGSIAARPRRALDDTARLLPPFTGGLHCGNMPRRSGRSDRRAPAVHRRAPLRPRTLDYQVSSRSRLRGGPSLGRPGRSCPVPGCGRHPERAGVGRPAAGAVRLVEAGQAAGRGRRLHGDVASLGVHYQGRPRRVARAAGRRPAGHGASAGRRAGLAPVSRATSATSSSS